MAGIGDAGGPVMQESRPMSTMIEPAVDELRFRLQGGLYQQGDPEYADACVLFNAMIERRPRYVARCLTVDDVVAALTFARAHALEVSVRAGGHSVAGWSLNDDGLVLDLRAMCDVEIDPERRIARVGGGATWAQFDAAAAPYGLATTGGRVSSTGVAGLTLGGGSGWLERKHGLACDNLVGAQLVTADGSIVRVSESENPDLLWALRGGGGNFGVVTELEFAMHPLPEQILGGILLHPAERGRELMKLFRDVMIDAPDGLDLAFLYCTGPDEEEIPAELRGRLCCGVAGMFAGSLEEGERALAEIRAFGPPAVDFFEPQAYATFNCSLDDPPGFRNWWTAENLDDLTDDVIEAIAAHTETGMPLGAAQFFMPSWGGEIARVGSDHSPLAGRQARFVAHPLLLWEDPAEDERNIAFGRAYRDILREHATGDAYLNFLGDEGAGRVRAGFGPNHARLAEIKAKWDPDNFFRANQNIRR
jgi:FAD/FMN-containing dehydrogenase